MSEIEPVIGSKKFAGQEIKKKYDVRVEDIHRSLVPWFQQNNYLFSENIASKDNPDGKEQKIEWTSYRKIDSYFKFHIDTTIFIQRWIGKKAEITIHFRGYLEKDWKSTFQRRWGKFLRNIYERYIIKERIEQMKSKMREETQDFIDLTRRFLNMPTR